ncbi:uncharacterized protein ISCGN_028432 [Ixodes scapularis]
MATSVTQVVGRLGHMEPFDDSASDWTSYDERLTSLLRFNKVPEKDKVHAFLSLIGPKTYGLLKSLTTSSLPSSKTFDELRRILGDHLAPRPSVIAERSKFYRRSQNETEFIADFVAELRKLSQSCDFEGFLDEALRDRKNLKVLSRASDVKLNGVTCPEQKPINIRVIFNETPLEMELDPAAAVSVISAKQQQRLFPSLQLTATALRFRTYTGALVEPKGVVDVTVKHNGQIHVLPLYVIEQGGPPLLGRQWLQRLRLDWNTVFTCNKLFSALGTTDKGAKAEKELNYLGHRLSAAGIHTTTEKTEAIRAAPAPANIQQLCSLLGAIIYYGKFLPRLATMAHPLYRLLREDQTWLWTRACQNAFDDIKNALASTEVLAHYDPKMPLQLACDASQYGVGAVLSHIFPNRTVRPVAYAPQGAPVKAGVWRVASPRTPSPAGGACTLGARCLVSSVTTDPSHVGHHTRTQGAPTLCYQRPSTPRSITVGDAVTVRNYRGQPRWVPGVVVQHKAPVSYTVKVQTSRGPAVWHRHQDQLLRSVPTVNQEQQAEDSSWECSSTPAASVTPHVTGSPRASFPQATPAEIPGSPQAAPATVSPPPAPRYPTRTRRPPDRYSPT